MNLFITDEELRAAGVSELDIDALDRNVMSQKGEATVWRPVNKRYLPAVEEVLAARGVTVNLRSGK